MIFYNQNYIGYQPCTVQLFQYHKFNTITNPTLNPVCPKIGGKTPDSRINENFLLKSTNGIAQKIA